MKPTCLSVILAVCASAQLTPDQRVSDFLHLAGIYAKNYAPYEWKRDALGFDLLNTAPWVERARNAKTDLDFYEVMAEYVASLDDAHDSYEIPSDFYAYLNFGVDLYDGKPLVESINRSRLPPDEFPLRMGYELVSIDGVPAADILKKFDKYARLANPRSSRRLAAAYLTFRPQSVFPRAAETGDVARVVMRRLDGDLETYIIPWTKSGLPLLNNGLVPTPGGFKAGQAAAAAESDDWRAALLELQRCKIDRPQTILGYGARLPIFALPQGFETRRAGFFYSGTFRAGGYRIGFLRIPDFSPSNISVALTEYLNEIVFLEANTDGLIVDVMRNPGGFVSVVNTEAQLLMPTRFRTIGFEVRATSEWVARASSLLEAARARGGEAWEIALLENIKNQVEEANASLRGRTGPIPLDSPAIDREPLVDNRGRVVAYTKPLMVLIDELSASGGDAFPATIQDNRRGILFGYRTMGAGGTVAPWDAGPYSEGSTSVTLSLMNRGRDIVTPEYPAAPYVENIGVRPDIEADYMTRDNLLREGRPFVDSFVAAMVEHIARSR